MPSYRSVPIVECGEPLVAIPRDAFGFTDPHPYVVLGAPYGRISPWQLRKSVLAALLAAQGCLGELQPGWRLKLFDAYRPLAVQSFMVWREFCRQASLDGASLAAFRDPAALAARDRPLYDRLAATVFTYWGIPSDDPRTPPPHSTGAAVDLTLEDASGAEADMGSPIDETTERSDPDHFRNAAEPRLRAAHERRELLHAVMAAAGFVRHANEWWHFSLGDQMAAGRSGKPHASYGRAELLPHVTGFPQDGLRA